MKKLGFFILFLAVVALVGGSRLIRLYNPQAIDAKKNTDLYLNETTNLEELSSLLVDSLQVTTNQSELNWAANILGWRKFQPGHYDIDSSYTYDDFLSKLAKGNQDPIELTIVPGQRQDKIISFLASRMRFDSTAIDSVLSDSTFLAENSLNDTTMIGRLFPATYDLYWTSSARQVLKRILNEYDKQITESFRERMDELEMSPNEVLTLASIIEWEAIHDDEKPKISGLYWNRLDRGMLLQADPTVNYAVDKQRRLYYKDYKIDHPYNTYIHKGLPPGPINNPSLSSVRAALYPDEHEYIYMVARPNGYHAFTETYAKHQQKSREWREYLERQENNTDTSENASG